jgi:alkane 1-monooxygenase
MYVLAAIPPLWFRVMDPKVVAWAGGDLGKINIHAPAADRIRSAYGTRQKAT